MKPGDLAISDPPPDRPVSHQSTLTFALAGALIVAVALGVAGYTRLQSDVEYMQTSVTALRGADATTETQSRNHELRIQRAEDNYQHILSSLVELKVEVRSMRSETIPARGGRR